MIGAMSTTDIEIRDDRHYLFIHIGSARIRSQLEIRAICML